MKAIKRIKNLVILLIILTGFTCKREKNDHCNGKWDERLKFANNSTMNLHIITTPNYPDTIITNIPSQSEHRDHYCALSQTRKLLELCDWESYFSKVPSGKLMIFLFNDTSNTGNSNPGINDIETNINNIIKYPFVKRYDLTYDQIVAMNWIVTYP